MLLKLANVPPAGLAAPLCSKIRKSLPASSSDCRLEMVPRKAACRLMLLMPILEPAKEIVRLPSPGNVDTALKGNHSASVSSTYRYIRVKVPVVRRSVLFATKKTSPFAFDEAVMTLVNAWPAGFSIPGTAIGVTMPFDRLNRPAGELARK